jgi:hypothetical protein
MKEEQWLILMHYVYIYVYMYAYLKQIKYKGVAYLEEGGAMLDGRSDTEDGPPLLYMHVYEYIHVYIQMYIHTYT